MINLIVIWNDQMMQALNGNSQMCIYLIHNMRKYEQQQSKQQFIS